MSGKRAIAAMVTPFQQNGQVDLARVDQLLEHLIAGGVQGVLVAGSQGEFYALRPDDKVRMVEAVVSAARGRVDVYAGVGAITTRDAVQQVLDLKGAGLEGLVVLTPYFVKPSEDEMCRHFSAIAEAATAPVILYSNPLKTGISVSARLVKRLATDCGIIGVKDSSGDLSTTVGYIASAPDGFNVYAGNDMLIFSALAYGGAGTISATANVVPRVVSEICRAFDAGDYRAAAEAQRRLAPLRAAFALGTFPVVVKEALAMLGLEMGEACPPVGELGATERKELAKVVQDLVGWQSHLEKH